MPGGKILILVDWFYPGYKAGGPIQSCINLCRALNTQYSIYVLTTDTDHQELTPYNNIESNSWLYNSNLNIHIYYAKKKTLTTKQLALQINFIGADFIYLNHLFSSYFVVYPLWLAVLNKIKAKIIMCPRGALYDSALSLKSYKKIPLLILYRWLGIHRRVIFHATNQREQTAIEKYFPGSHIIVADNLPNSLQGGFKTITKEPGKLLCIFISRIVPIKNLIFLLRVLQDVKQQVELTIAGPVEDETYWKQCKKYITHLPSNIRVHYTGPKSNHEIAGLIQQHHLFILPTTGENFGHSIFEALLAGRPVLISDQTPWHNLQHQNAGWDLPLAYPPEFLKVIEQLSACSQDGFDTMAKGAWNFAATFLQQNDARKKYKNLFS